MSQPEDSHQYISHSEKERSLSKYKDIIVPSDKAATEKNTLYVVTTEDAFQDITTQLKSLENHFEHTSVILIAMKENITEIEDEIKRCIESQHHSMCILSSSNTFHKEIIGMYESLKEPSNLGNCSSDGREIWHHKTGFSLDTDKLLYLSNIIQFGLQLQLSPKQLFNAMDEEYYEYYRIGHFKNEMEEVEPIMRDLNIFQLSCNTIRHADFHAKYDDNPSGFFAEEALQLIKYASLSPYLSFVLIHDIDPEKLNVGSIEFLAQAIWYTTHGTDVRMEDSPYELENMQEYIVDHDYYDFPISFLKSKKSGRWWIKIPNNHEDRAPFVCISCSEKDYMEVFEDRIPGRLIRAIERNR